MLQKQYQLDKNTSSFRIGIDSNLLLEYSDSTEYIVFKKESPSPVEVEPGDLFLLKYGKRKKKQSITGKEIEKVRDHFPCSSRISSNCKCRTRNGRDKGNTIAIAQRNSPHLLQWLYLRVP
ncbi:hypothetical protein H5410_029760 [Solanum commersonii]|uniref:Uncharacterized protein n=1 Tax=Solanum commersonii TaxID=4109 RepID=A0A9J5YHB0_SOLCO|nr:hypothetical protein H5410_029760 [Solanum commersonii]